MAKEPRLATKARPPVIDEVAEDAEGWVDLLAERVTAPGEYAAGTALMARRTRPLRKHLEWRWEGLGDERN
jgi:hypothetical protein